MKSALKENSINFWIQLDFNKKCLLPTSSFSLKKKKSHAFKPQYFDLEILPHLPGLQLYCPAVTSPPGQPTSPIVSYGRWGIHQGRMQRAHHCRDCRVGKSPVPQLFVSMGCASLPTPGEQQVTGNLVPHLTQYLLTNTCVLLASLPPTQLGHFCIAITAIPCNAYPERHKSTRLTETPWICALLFLPKESYGTTTKA